MRKKTARSMSDARTPRLATRPLSTWTTQNPPHSHAPSLETQYSVDAVNDCWNRYDSSKIKLASETHRNS
jgi:hypothetical protein